MQNITEQPDMISDLGVVDIKTGIAPPPAVNPSLVDRYEGFRARTGVSRQTMEEAISITEENRAKREEFIKQHKERKLRGPRTISRGRPLIAQAKTDRDDKGHALPLTYIHENTLYNNGKVVPFKKEGVEPGRNDFVYTTVNGQEVRVKYKNLWKLKEAQT